MKTELWILLRVYKLKLIKMFISIYIITNILIIHYVDGKEGDVLINNEEKLIESGKPYVLFEDYTLTITITGRERVFISLSKNGNVVVHSKYASLENQLYRGINNKTGQHILSFYIANIKANEINVKNMVQYSDGGFTPTPAPTINTKSNLSLVAEGKTLLEKEAWEIGEGWELKAQSIDSKAKQVSLSIYNNSVKLNETILYEGAIYSYDNIFMTNINSIFNQGNKDFVRLTDTYIDSRYIPTSIPKPTHTQIQTETSNSNLGDKSEIIIENRTSSRLIIMLFIAFIIGIIILRILRR